MTLHIILKYNNMEDSFANGIHVLLLQLIFYNVAHLIFSNRFSLMVSYMLLQSQELRREMV